jgi:hypothetical protein
VRAWLFLGLRSRGRRFKSRVSPAQTGRFTNDIKWWAGTLA